MESWMFLDEYERREDYDKWMKAVREDPELVKLMDEWFPK
jgi:ABC-type amino acid transport substrate-binding protein